MLGFGIGAWVLLVVGAIVAVVIGLIVGWTAAVVVVQRGPDPLDTLIANLEAAPGTWFMTSYGAIKYHDGQCPLEVAGGCYTIDMMLDIALAADSRDTDHQALRQRMLKATGLSD